MLKSPAALLAVAAILASLHAQTGKTRNEAAQWPTYNRDLVLNANPLDDINNTRRIAKVYLNGKELDRAAMRAAWLKP